LALLDVDDLPPSRKGANPLPNEVIVKENRAGDQGRSSGAGILACLAAADRNVCPTKGSAANHLYYSDHLAIMTLVAAGWKLGVPPRECVPDRKVSVCLVD
jgi:hypothetical protein